MSRKNIWTFKKMANVYVKIYIYDLIVQLKYVLIIVVVMVNVLTLSVNVINHFMETTVHNKLAKMNVAKEEVVSKEYLINIQNFILFFLIGMLL